MLKKLFNWLGGEIKQAVQIIKDNLFLVVGVGLFVGGLFDFGSSRYCEKTSILLSLSGKCLNPATYYYYNEASIALLVVGAIFIIIGILRLRRK